MAETRETIGGMTEWLAAWAERNGCTLDLDGEVGFGRECVGILRDGSYVDYDYDGAVHVGGPGEEAPDAYHKADCLCVLGLGSGPIEQLYRWVKKLDADGIKVSVVARGADDHSLDAFLGKRTRAVLVRS